MLMVAETANTDLPLLGSCNELLICGKYAPFSFAVMTVFVWRLWVDGSSMVNVVPLSSSLSKVTVL